MKYNVYMKKISYQFSVLRSQLLVKLFVLILTVSRFIGIHCYSQGGLAINTSGTAADGSAILDVSSTSQGLLIPRVALTGVNDATTIASPTTSLMVYCTGTGGLSPAGYYYNSGTSVLPVWTKFLTGGNGSGWSLTGNAGTVNGTNFLGTTDNIPFNIKVNNQKAGRIDHIEYNTFFGYLSGNNATGNYNTLLGNKSGSSQTTATENVFVGSGSGYYLQTGSSNTAIGYNALYCYGASGGGPLKGGTGNVAIGKWAMFNPWDGDYNVAIGFSAYSLPHTGSENVFIGNYTDVSWGFDPSYATAIGSRAKADANNSTALGYRACANAANTLILGSINGQNGATSNVNVGIGTTAPGGQFELSLDQGRKPGTNTWTITSDERLKNIKGLYTKGLKEILQLQPITYHYKNAGERKFADEVLNTLNVGFSAQDVQKVFPEAVGVDKDGYFNLNIHSILVAYINAIKEQQNMIDSFKIVNSQQSAVNRNLQSAIDNLQEQNGNMQAEIEKIKQQVGMEAKK